MSSDQTASPARHIAWTKGGHAEIVGLDGETITVRSTTSAPPGARLESAFVADPQVSLKLKSYGTHKESDGSFTLKGRLIDATREVRERLVGLVQAAGAARSDTAGSVVS